jgi:hypothetical protein
LLQNSGTAAWFLGKKLFKNKGVFSGRSKAGADDGRLFRRVAMAMSRIRTFIVAAAASLALGGCASYGGYGGYGGASLGYGDGSPYYGAGYASGWYDDFYYPGRGIYVYDRVGKRHRWNDNQRRHWEGRRNTQRDR